jgi:predicted aspartyl protease
VISRRALLFRLPLLAAGGLTLWLLRNRVPWPPPRLTFAQGQSSGWIRLPRDAGLILMDGKVSGHPIRLVVDSGAQFSAIDRALAERLALPQLAALPMVAYGVSGEPSLTHMVHLDLALPGLAVARVRAAALDISRLSVVTGRDFSMLLGRDVLSRLVVEADLPHDRAAFHAPAAYRLPPDGVVAPLMIAHGAPTLTVRVDGAPMEVMVDTGATGALAVSAAAAEAAGLLSPGRAVSQAHSVSLGGLSLDRIVVARRLEVQGLVMRDAPVQIYSPAAPGPLPSGLLGIGFLRRFRMALDLGGRRLILQRPTLSLAPGL